MKISTRLKIIEIAIELIRRNEQNFCCIAIAEAAEILDEERSWDGSVKPFCWIDIRKYFPELFTIPHKIISLEDTAWKQTILEGITYPLSTPEKRYSKRLNNIRIMVLEELYRKLLRA